MQTTATQLKAFSDIFSGLIPAVNKIKILCSSKVKEAKPIESRESGKAQREYSVRNHAFLLSSLAKSLSSSRNLMQRQRLPPSLSLSFILFCVAGRYFAFSSYSERMKPNNTKVKSVLLFPLFWNYYHRSVKN